MKDIYALHPEAQYKALQLVEKCKEAGLIIKIGECVRTVEEQNKLYSQGRTKPGVIVTNANGTAYKSMHQWGVAFDIIRADGKGAYYNADKFFNKVGAIGKSLDLIWGGDWISIIDLPHFQLGYWGDTPKKLIEKYKTPEAFMRTWQYWQLDNFENEEEMEKAKECKAMAAVQYYPKYTGKSKSIVDALNSLKIDSSKATRKKIAAANSLHSYQFTAEENTRMLQLLKEGKLIKCD